MPAARTIYLLIDPRCGSVRYVGVTTLPLPKRLGLHLASARARQDHRLPWFDELADCGLEPVPRAYHTLSADEDWMAAERAAIAHFAAIGSLLNKARVGSSSSGAKHSEEARRRHADATRRQFADVERREAFSQRARDSHRTEFARANASRAALLREASWTPERRAEVLASRRAGRIASYAAREAPASRKEG